MGNPSFQSRVLLEKGRHILFKSLKNDERITKKEIHGFLEDVEDELPVSSSVRSRELVRVIDE